jgi:hypothetical protein
MELTGGEALKHTRVGTCRPYLESGKVPSPYSPAAPADLLYNLPYLPTRYLCTV